MADAAIIVTYIALAALLLAGGDRLGSYAACILLRRCRRPPLLCLPMWLHVPIALLIPGLALAGVLTTAAVHRPNALEVIADNLELMLLAAFFLTGLMGGFLCSSRRS